MQWAMSSCRPQPRAVRFKLAWPCRASTELVAPLNGALRRYVMGTGKLHANNTPVPVLTHLVSAKPCSAACGRICATTARQAILLRRRFGPPILRIGKASIRTDLATFTGTLQADGYAGFNRAI